MCIRDSLYTVTAGSGEVRGYLVLAVLGGAAAYFWLLSRWFLWLGYRLADFLGLVWGLVTLPLVLLARLGKKIEKNAKKSFHYRRKWYKIGVLLSLIHISLFVVLISSLIKKPPFYAVSSANIPRVAYGRKELLNGSKKDRTTHREKKEA